MVSREFPDRHRSILSKGQRPHCLLYWWTHQKRYNLTLWRMFEIQDVGRANIYPSEYILLAGIFDRPPSPHGWCQLRPDRFFISAAPPRYMCSVCVHLGWSKTVEGEAAYFHMSIPDLPRPQGELGGFPPSRQLFGHHSALFKLKRVPSLWFFSEWHNQFQYHNHIWQKCGVLCLNLTNYCDSR